MRRQQRNEHHLNGASTLGTARAVHTNMIWRRRHRRPVLTIVSAAFFLFFLYNFSVRFLRPSASRSTELPAGQKTHDDAPKIIRSQEKELVVASMAGDDTSWLDEYFDTWTKNIYVVNNASAPLTVAVNKGREAMPFLTCEDPICHRNPPGDR